MKGRGARGERIGHMPRGSRFLESHKEVIVISKSLLFRGDKLYESSIWR